MEALLRLRDQPGTAAIDLRSEGEFAEASLPRSRNLPILVDAHRHLVGLCFKEQGQQAAIALGERLVADSRAAMISAWSEALTKAHLGTGFIFCWRGGLRSQTAGLWLRQQNVPFALVEGGYKAMRKCLLGVFQDYPPLLVIAGMTGSGKTQLLRRLPHRVDLELAAHHRGSAFGSLYLPEQPAQQTFENAVALAMLNSKQRLCVEDESRKVGRCVLPPGLYERMAVTECVVVEATVEERCRNIYQDYVLSAAASGESSDVALNSFLASLDRISKRLGGVLTAVVRDHMKRAFALGFHAEPAHLEWIAVLLTEYYDRQYRHALATKERRVVFTGDLAACESWVKEAYHHA